MSLSHNDVEALARASGASMQHINDGVPGIQWTFPGFGLHEFVRRLQPQAVSATTTALIDMLRQRDAAGLKKYGTTLDRADLSLAEWLQHLTEELLDGAGYAQAALRTLSVQAAMAPEVVVRSRFVGCAKGFCSKDYADGYLEALKHVEEERAKGLSSSPDGAEADKIGFCSFDPGDRFYHAADRTWWRSEDGQLVRAQAPEADVSAWRIDPEPWQHEDDVWTCGIDIGDHSAAIECHADTKEKALARAEAVMRSSASQPYSIDEDPAGIRARVADAIRVALREGACGKIEPAEDHWLSPFWQMARAEAEKAERPREEVMPGNVDDNADYIEHCAGVLKRTGYPSTGSALMTVAGEYRRLVAEQPRDPGFGDPSPDIDSIALDAARRCTPEGEPQGRAKMQGAIADAVLAQQNDDAPMIGKMVEANFSTQLVTFRMVGGYKCRAGEYRIQRMPQQKGPLLPEPLRPAPPTQNRT